MYVGVKHIFEITYPRPSRKTHCQFQTRKKLQVQRLSRFANKLVRNHCDLMEVEKTWLPMYLVALYPLQGKCRVVHEVSWRGFFQTLKPSMILLPSISSFLCVSWKKSCCSPHKLSNDVRLTVPFLENHITFCTASEHFPFDHTWKVLTTIITWWKLAGENCSFFSRMSFHFFCRTNFTSAVNFKLFDSIPRINPLLAKIPAQLGYIWPYTIVIGIL